MSVKVRIPSPLRRMTGSQSTVEVSASTLDECLNNLEAQFPGIKERLCDAEGQVQQFVNIYVNGEDIRFLQELATPLKAGDEVSIVPAMAGG
ncbi:MAG: ubiquitin-like small modifier protein 1 [Dehalococcoidia bacterium]